ncbi:MAG TPA: DUF4232 domain-containing protein [Candidatus Limnocylindrales bacterium]
MWFARGIAAAALVSIVGACQPIPPSQQPSGPVTTPVAASTPLGSVAARGCGPDDVLVWGGRTSGGTGSVQTDVRITSISTTPCELLGPPSAVQLLDADGQPLPLVASLISPDPGEVTSTLLLPGFTADVGYNWSNWCKADPGSLVVSLRTPGGDLAGALADPPEVQLLPRCDDPGSPSVVELLWGFQPDEEQPPAAASPVAIGPCQPGDVAIGSVWWTGATAEMEGGVSLIDVGSTPCQVGGRPSGFQMLDRRGQPLDLEVKPLAPDMEEGLVLLLPQDEPASSEALFPGQTGVAVSWTNWCGRWDRQGTLVMTLPGLGQLRAPFIGLSAPRCDTPGAPSVIQVGPVITPR